MSSRLFPTFSSMRFRVSVLTLRSVIHVELSFGLGNDYGPICLLYAVIQSTAPLVEDASFFQCVFTSLSKLRCPQVCGLISGSKIPLKCLFLCQQYDIFITLALWYNLKIRNMVSPAFLLSLRVVLAILGPFVCVCLHMKLSFQFLQRIMFRILMGIVLNLQENLSIFSVFFNFFIQCLNIFTT